MNSENLNEMIVIEQLPIIREKLEAMKTDITERTTAALALDCTEETVKTVKKARAELNSEFKFWEGRRSDVKRAIMAPYEQFEAAYDECIRNVYRTADAELKEKISSVESELKSRKESEIRSYFEEYRLSKNIDIVTYEQAGINITLSASTKSLKEQVRQFIDRISDDLKIIATYEFAPEIIVEYKNTLNASEAITSVINRHKAIEAEKAAEEERTAREKEMAEIEKQVDEIVPPTVEPIITPPVVEENDPILTLAFKVTATKSKLKELKNFLINGGYDYE